MAKAVDDDGSIKCFNLLDGPADGDQDLNLWIREGGRCLSGDYGRSYLHRQSNHFKMDLDELGKSIFGGDANAGVSFQIGQLRYVLFHD